MTHPHTGRPLSTGLTQQRAAAYTAGRGGPGAPCTEHGVDVRSINRAGTTFQGCRGVPADVAGIPSPSAVPAAAE